MQKQKMILLFATTVAIVLTISILSVSTAMAILRINTPIQGQKVPAGSFLTVTGTSMPSNATHTKCNVQLQTNQHGYKPVSPLGPVGTYTTWKGATSEPVKVGVNQVEGQLLCFAANGTPNLIKHIVHNFTGIQTNSGISITPTLPFH
ncbi:MAG: hypothetical protein M3P08_19565 [Thermoproteota archaeon]|jgi:hypothetical protein|nr:hypothetical protein [Thermoproteota archaeon]